MAFVKTAEDIERLQQALHAPQFVNAQVVSVDFRTTPEIIERILPPTFDAAPEPRVSVKIGRWQSNCVGNFTGAIVYVAARHQGVDGDYGLAMYMNGDSPLIYGRELFGEPKKLAEITLARQGAHHFRGHVDRKGVRIIEISAELGLTRDPDSARGEKFNVKARPAADGFGLEEDAIVTSHVAEVQRRVHLEGTGSVTLRGTVHDPLDELEIVEIVGARYVESDQRSSNRAVGTIPAADYLPYFYGRHGDDWTALDTTGNAATELPESLASEAAVLEANAALSAAREA